MHAAGGAWSAAILQFVAGVIVVRSLTPQGVGTFVFASAIATFVFGVLDIRIEEGLTQFLVREKSSGRDERTASALRYAVAVDIASGLAISALMLLAIAFLPFHLGHETKVVAAITAFASLIAISDGSFLAIFYAHQAFGWLASYQLVSNGSRCLALLIVPIATASDAALAIALAQVVATTFLISAVVIRFLSRGGRRGRLTQADRRWLLRFSAHVAVSSAAATVRANATPLVMGILGTKREVAGARVAESPTKLLGVAVAPLRTVLFPRLSAAWARRDRTEARYLIREYLWTSAIAGGVFGMAMALAMNPILTRIYGPEYSDLARVGQIFVLAAVLDALAGWQKVAPAALDRPWLRTYILVGESAALLLALLILVPPYGPLGASISAAVAAGISLGLGALWLRPAFSQPNWLPDKLRRSREGARIARRPG
jgi:O-antigen/teichoic acid export membrane protein